MHKIKRYQPSFDCQSIQWLVSKIRNIWMPEFLRYLFRLFWHWSKFLVKALKLEKYIWKISIILKKHYHITYEIVRMYHSRKGGKNGHFHGKRNDLENNIYKHCIFSKIKSMCNAVFQNIETKPSFLNIN